MQNDPLETASAATGTDDPQTENQETPTVVPAGSPSEQPKPDAAAPVVSLPQAGGPNKPKPNRKRLWLTIVATLLIVGGAAAYWFLIRKQPKPVPSTPPVVKTETKPQTQKPGYIFFDAPKQLGDLNFFYDLGEEFGYDCTNIPSQKNCPPSLKASDISYFQIGTTPSNQSIIAAVVHNGIGSSAYIAIETSANHYAVIGKLSYLASANNDQGVTQQADFVKGLNSNVTLDMTTAIPELAFSDSVNIKGATLTIPDGYAPPYGGFIDGLPNIRGLYYDTPLASSNLNKLGELNGKTYYEVTVKDSDNYQVKELYGAVKGVYAASYMLPDKLIADKPAITWTTGDKTVSSYTSRTQGCGSANGFVVAKNVNASQLTQAGQGPSGEALYELPTTDPLFQEIYTNDYDKGSNASNSSLKNLSAQDFQANHGVFVAKNALDEYVVYMRTDMIITGGCGKPVIYLYPQTPTEVSVKVGAAVSKSDPQYSLNGWQNVLALPSSHLFYQDKEYPSLYWEGLGFGVYPTITFGTIVPQAQVVSTIRQQLAAQGFTPQETSDFLDFWQSRLPSTPYVRLSWLNTEQMNQLAPLSISPRPTTLIRTFLDFQGLDAPEQLQPQHFTAPSRQGFTVVEWGGLLRQ